VDFCAHCDATLKDGRYCGLCAGTPCDLDPLCIPNMECSGPPGNLICNLMFGCGAVPNCWDPSENATCL
jgi:hypothetical protein